jgi:N-acetyl-anhydromuramyl-L-alanine amidase AmpD
MITLLQLRPYTGDEDDAAPSPNQDARFAGAIEGIVLHATADAGNEAGTLSWLRSPKSRVSCHLLVSRTGRVTRLVGDQQRAWHAGVSWWRGTSDVNSITLGVEIANRNDGEPYTDAQYRRVAEIVAHYCRQGLSLEDVIGHEAIADDRRTDPLGWDWGRFRTMVQDQLRAEDVEGRRRLMYDRRSGEAVASGAHPKKRVPSSTSPKQRVPPITTGKPVLCSRIIWLNGLTVLAAGSVIVGETLDLAFSVGITVPETITMWALFCVGLVNIVLRFQTTCPIGSSECADPLPPVTTIRVPQRGPGHDTGRAAAGPR